MIGKVDSAGSRVVTLRTQVTLSHCKLRCCQNQVRSVLITRLVSGGGQCSRVRLLEPRLHNRENLRILASQGGSLASLVFATFHFLPYGQKIRNESRLWSMDAQNVFCSLTTILLTQLQITWLQQKRSAGVFIDLQNQLMTINSQDGARSFDCYEATPATR